MWKMFGKNVYGVTEGCYLLFWFFSQHVDKLQLMNNLFNDNTICMRK